MANSNSATYQWVPCDPGSATLSGDTNQAYTPPSAGFYAVIVTENGCIDTSGCHFVSTSGVWEYQSKNKSIIQPNPTNGQFTIEFREKLDKVYVSITDLGGKIMKESMHKQISTVQLSFEAPAGLYIVSVVSDQGNEQHKLIKF